MAACGCETPAAGRAQQDCLLGRNYLDHAAEFNNAPPKEPLIFLKPPSSLLAPEDAIVLLPEVQRIDFEGELAVIMSRKCR